MAKSAGKILVVDDEPEVRLVLAEFLESQGYEVSANTPEEFSTFIRNEIARLRKVVNDLGIRADD